MYNPDTTDNRYRRLPENGLLKCHLFNLNTSDTLSSGVTSTF